MQRLTLLTDACTVLQQLAVSLKLQGADEFSASLAAWADRCALAVPELSRADGAGDARPDADADADFELSVWSRIIVIMKACTFVGVKLNRWLK